MKILMDYPDDKLINENYDGKTHEIEPAELRSITIGKKEIYLMRYADVTINNPTMITILEKYNGGLRKVPLKKYGNEFAGLCNLIYTMGKEEYINKLPLHIKSRSKSIQLENYLQEKDEQLKSMPKKVIIIFKDYKTGKYYYDPNGKNEIVGAPDSLGKLTGRIIIGKNNIDYEIKPLNLIKTNITIYYDSKKDKYYYDANGTKEILNAPNCLGMLSKKDNKIYGNGKYDYVIYPVIKKQTKSAIRIYFNKFDNNYYADELCTKVIPNALESLGKLSNDKKKIENGNIEYIIINVYISKKSINDKAEQKGIRQIFFNTNDYKYYWDKNCKNEIDNAPFSLGILLNNIIHGDNGIDYIIVKVKVPTKINNMSSMFDSTDNNEKKLNIIFYNKNEKKFYWDKECTLEITNGLKSLETKSGKITLEKDGIRYEVHVVSFEDENQGRKRK